jgi:hypothetical protein
MSNTDPNVPVVGQPIQIAFFDGDHVVHQSVAHVLSLGPVDPFTNQPTISVAYPTPGADPSVLSSASWFKGYSRSVGVQHVSHPHVQASQVSIAYGDVSDFPQPAGSGNNPIFGRPADLPATDVSFQQKRINDGELLAETQKAPGDPTAANKAQERTDDEPHPLGTPIHDADGPVVETKTYTDGTTATGVAPLPDQSPAQQDAADTSAEV